jgi:superfamily I DNA/RNA helicase
MLGRDLGKGLLALSRKLAPEDSTPVDVLAGKLLEWEEREIALARANEKEEKIAGIVDRAECIRAVLGVEVRDAGELRFALTNLFERNSGIVTLGSIHRSKGLEWDTVIHLDPWRVPSKWAKLAAEAGDPVPLEQEWNLKYVCETRTKHTLLLANLSDFA